MKQHRLSFIRSPRPKIPVLLVIPMTTVITQHPPPIIINFLIIILIDEWNQYIFVYRDTDPECMYKEE